MCQNEAIADLPNKIINDFDLYNLLSNPSTFFTEIVPYSIQQPELFDSFVSQQLPSFHDLMNAVIQNRHRKNGDNAQPMNTFLNANAHVGQLLWDQPGQVYNLQLSAIHYQLLYGNEVALKDELMLSSEIPAPNIDFLPEFSLGFEDTQNHMVFDFENNVDNQLFLPPITPNLIENNGEPSYPCTLVNPKQYNRIMKRRLAKMRRELQENIPKRCKKKISKKTLRKEQRAALSSKGRKTTVSSKIVRELFKGFHDSTDSDD